jgi:hypothetical protein
MRDDHASTAVLEPTRARSTELDAQSAARTEVTEDQLPTVQPLDYVKLRLLAECAAGAVNPLGATNTPAQFFFRKAMDSATHTEKTELNRRALGTTLQDTDVLVPTLDAGRFPRNVVHLEVVATLAPGGYNLDKAGIADALFWSDAAVQKFVFPYIASCGGDGATAVLEQLQHAWNHYPGNVVVYALVHLTSSVPGQQLAMDRSIGVAFEYTNPTGEQQPGLQIVTLADFGGIIGQERSQGVATAPKPVPFRLVDPATSTALPTYVQLRAMAEWACSVNDETHYFVFPANGDGTFDVYPQQDLDLTTLDPADVVVPAFTPTVPEGRPVLKGVWFQPDGTSIVANVATQGDALFWSTAAIEQFVIPYYASKGGMETLPALSDIASEWTAGTSSQGEPFYALIHLPHSEWTEVITEAGMVKVEVDVMAAEAEAIAAAIDAMPATLIGAASSTKRGVRRLDPRAQLAKVTLHDWRVRSDGHGHGGDTPLSGRPGRP